MGRILITNGKIWDGEQFFFGSVLVEQNKIVKIIKHRETMAPEKIAGEAWDCSALASGANFIYNAEGKIVSAGFVDSHVHMRGISSAAFGIQVEMSVERITY